MTGIITTVGTTQAFLATMAVNLEVQRKLQQEIDEVIGARQPRLADRPNMPLMEAVGFPLYHSTSWPTNTKYQNTTQNIFENIPFTVNLVLIFSIISIQKT